MGERNITLISTNFFSTLYVVNREQSKKDKRRFREKVSGETSTRSKKGSAPVVQEDIDFSSADIELLKVKLVLETDCSLWPVETAEELGKILARFTKAVAERPFK